MSRKSDGRYEGRITYGQVLRRGPLIEVVYALSDHIKSGTFCTIRRQGDPCFVLVLDKGKAEVRQESGPAQVPPGWLDQAQNLINQYVRGGQ